MKSSDAFSIQNAESWLEKRHFKTIDCESGDASTVVDTVMEAFEEEEVDVKAKLIDAANKFNPDIQQAFLVDVYQDIGGARGRVYKRRIWKLP